jgi:hypothetical protein
VTRVETHLQDLRQRDLGRFWCHGEDEGRFQVLWSCTSWIQKVIESRGADCLENRWRCRQKNPEGSVGKKSATRSEIPVQFPGEFESERLLGSSRCLKGNSPDSTRSESRAGVWFAGEFRLMIAQRQILSHLIRNNSWDINKAMSCRDTVRMRGWQLESSRC